MSDWLPEIRRRLAGAGLEPAREAEIAQELAQHLEQRYLDMRALGADEDQARRAALAELDDDARMRTELSRAEASESTVVPLGTPTRRRLAADLWQDVRYAARMLRRSPAFTALAVLTLALGIGATTVVYAIIDHTLLRPAPYHDLDRLVRVFEIDEKKPTNAYGVSYPNLQEWIARSRSFETLGTYRSQTITLLDGEPERVTAGLVSDTYFAVMGVQPAHGRGFTADDALPGAPRVIVLSHAAWQRRFGAASDIIGRTIAAVGGSYEVIGVLPAAKIYAGSNEFWLPMARTPVMSMRQARMLPVMGHLREQVTLTEAQAEMTAVAAALALEHPDANAGWSVRLVPLQEQMVGHLRQPLYTFLGAVGCILLIACVNVAGLLVARGAGRSREIAVRLSLGAGRGRVVRQLLTESVVLAVVGGALGALLAWWSISALVPLFPLTLPADRVAVDLRVLLVACAASTLTGLLFGLVPAIGASRAGVASALKDESRATSRWGRRVSATLIVAEVGLALMLLVGAGLMVRTLAMVYMVDPGVDVDRVTSVRVTPLLPPDAPPARAGGFYGALLERIAALPGVESVAAIDTAPFGGSSVLSGGLVEGAAAPVTVSPRSVTPGYFRTMGIELRAGRDLAETDRDGAPPMIVVNRTAAERLWPGRNPLGQTLRYEGLKTTSEWYTVVGVVDDVRHDALDEEVLAEVYHPVAQRPKQDLTVVVRGPDPAALAAAVRSYLPSLPERALYRQARSFASMVDATTLQRRNRAMLLGVLGILGVALAAIGVFGLTAYSVSQRTREVGIRMALGADGARVLRTVVGSQLLPIGVGVAVGVVGSWWATRVLTAYLFGVRPTDPATFAAVAAIITAVGLIACYIPARRVLRVDPVAALRAE